MFPLRNFLYLLQPVKTVCHNICRNLIFHHGSRSSRTFGILECKCAVIADFFYNIHCFEEVLLSLSRNPTIISVVRDIRYCPPDPRSTRSRYCSFVYRRFIFSGIRVLPDCTGRCRCLQIFRTPHDPFDQFVGQIFSDETS